MEELGQIVDKIRRDRQITIESLTEGIVSPSTYLRFVSGDTELSSDSFLKIIRRFNSGFAMFLQDHLSFFFLRHNYGILNYAESYNDIGLVEELVTVYQDMRGKEGWRKQDERFLLVAEALAALMTNAEDAEDKLRELQSYFASLKFFTDNDFLAFRTLTNFMTIDTIEKIIDRPLKRFKNLKDPGLGENMYHVCGIVYLKHLQAGNLKKAKKYYAILEEVYIDQIDVGWKMGRHMYKAFNDYFSGQELEGIQTLSDLRTAFNDLALDHQVAFMTELAKDMGIPLKEIGGT